MRLRESGLDFLYFSQADFAFVLHLTRTNLFASYSFGLKSTVVGTMIYRLRYIIFEVL